MRKGHNPAKQDVPAYQPEKLGIATLTYIPVQEGYFAQCWEIFKLHLASVHQYTPEPFNYVVFDNGSCPEVKRGLETLHEEGWIDWLILSEQNLGKTGALNWLLSAFPNEWICFADSDMLFRPGWLEASWKINDAFPGCGMIGAQVVFPDWEVDKGNTQFRKTQDPRFLFSQVKPEAWIVDEYCRGRGIPEDRAITYANMLLDQVENVECRVKAILGGNSHQQWLARRDVIQEILPLPSKLQLNRQQTTYQDRRMDELNYPHLTTTIPYLYHIGNTIDDELKPELSRLSVLEAGKAKTVSEKAPEGKGLLTRGLLGLSRGQLGRRALRRLYNALYIVFSEAQSKK
jgi:glycosyltransferase involved in cell wall biosynthesis